jgi:hypothetical protein
MFLFMKKILNVGLEYQYVHDIKILKFHFYILHMMKNGKENLYLAGRLHP